MEPAVESRTVHVEGLDLHYLEAGSGPPVLLLHGWPSNAGLYRHALPVIGASRRAIALDLPGFGASSKPTDVSYSFRFWDRVLTAFLDALGIARTGLVVHDLGGPIGLHWLASHRDRVTDLTLLNTVVFPEMSWAVKLFVVASRIPGLRALLASPWGIAQAMKVGIRDRSRHTPETLARYTGPYAGRAARKALLKSAHGLHPQGFHTIVDGLRGLELPVRLLYGERDGILPDVATTMRRVKDMLPHAELSSIPDCGHFLQEDRPDEVARALAEFLSQACESAA